MRRRRCAECGRSFPMNSGFTVLGRALCEACAESRARGFGGQMPVEAFRPLVDPTICNRCGRDNESQELRIVADVPLCAECGRVVEAVPEDLQRVLIDVEQYVSLGFVEDAKEALAKLGGRYSDHPALVQKLAELGLSEERFAVASSSVASIEPDTHAKKVITHDAAKRLARLIVSEIGLYNRSWKPGERNAAHLRERVRSEIERGHQYYRWRVSDEVRRSTDYYQDAVADILCGRDPRALESLLERPVEHSSDPDSGETHDLARELGGLFDTQVPVTEEDLGEEGLVDVGDEALPDLFREFQKGVDRCLGKEDFETRYNLGVAYKEMGLLDEAIAEFQLAAKDESRLLECASMLGICFIEKGMARLAVKWFDKGLQAPGRTEQEYMGLRYDLATAHEAAGEPDKALEIYTELYGQDNAGFRDVADIPTESLVRLSGLMVTVTRAFRLNEGELTTEEQDQIRRTLRRTEETLSEGRVDEIAECIKELEAAARLLERFPVGH